EGGGLRCWGLAKGLLANNPKLDVTVAYNDSYKTKDFVNKFEGINLITWNMDSIKGLVTSYHTIIVSYCMGDLSTIVADNILPTQQLILDCYVPIYVEVSARDSSD